MPNYKTHSIHLEEVLKEYKLELELAKHDIRSFAMGPDTLIATDYKIFEYQHANKTKDYFLTLIELIKDKKLQDNPEVMAFLYGQIDHFILDETTHPMIYYMTYEAFKPNLINPHGLLEMRMDEYFMHKYNINDYYYYQKKYINDHELTKLISELYYKVYGVKNEGIKYNMGMYANLLFDSLFRQNALNIPNIITKVTNMGNVLYGCSYNNYEPYMNLEHNKWTNPLSGEEYYDSFDDLFNKATDLSRETFDDVNKYLYHDKEIKNPLLLNNISYNTGFPCEKGENFQYVKKYKKN